MTAEELRKSILQMAIQGKLVKQDPNDEPASVLLERIREEKTRLIKEGKIKGKMTDSVIYKGSDNSYYEKVGKTEVCIDDEIPFELPDSWAWVRHNDIIEISGGAQPPKAKFIDSPRPGYIRLYQIRDYGPSPQPIYIPIETATKTTQKGDILLARYGASLGKVFVAEDGAYNVAMAKVIPLFESMLIDRDYLLLFYKSSIYQGTILGHARSAQAGFNKEDLSGMLFPVPPLKEQQRIVKKVASFNPFIEEYARYNDQEKALDSDIGMLLRKSILQYAIQGKLVPQDPTDEPASVLLERIRTERETANVGKKSKAKTESYIFKNSNDNSYYEKIGEKVVCIDEEIPFELPNGWVWTRLGNIGYWGAGATPLRSKGDYYGGKIPWLKTGELNGSIIYGTQEHITEKALKECSLRLCEPGDVLIAMYGATIGKLAIAGVPMTTNQACCACTVHQGISNLYLFRYLEAIKPVLIEQGAGGAQPNISREKIVNTLIPLPPTKEQHRICTALDKILEIASH